MRSALGKGLNALISDDVVTSVAAPPKSAAPVDVIPRTLPLDKINPNPKQPRRDFSETALDELAHSIRQKGVLQPIVVSPSEGGSYEIIAGERRWRAAARAGLKDIPVVIRGGTEAEKFELALIENLQRENLNPIEQAFGYQRLQDEFQMTQEAIAKVMGKDRAVVANALRFLTLSQTIQQALREGVISSGHAKALLSVEDVGEREILFQRITSENMTVRAVEDVGRAKKKIIRDHASSTGYDNKPAEVRALEEELQHVLGRKVDIHALPSHKGSIKLEFYSLDDFDALISRLKKSV